MDWTLIPLPLSFTSSWLYENWRIIAAIPSTAAFVIFLYKKGFIRLANSRWDADRCEDQLKRSLASESQCLQRESARDVRERERDDYIKGQLADLQKELDWAYSYIRLSRESGVTPDLPMPKTSPLPPLTPTTMTSSDPLPTPDKRLFPSENSS